jgi:DNA-binding GntR family transcriptional regulator
MINAAQPYRRALTLSDPRRTLATTNEEHQLLLDAVRHNRADEAASILFEHIHATRQALAMSLDTEAPGVPA